MSAISVHSMRIRRTVKQVPRRAAGIVAPPLPKVRIDPEGHFPVADQIRAASSHARRATILLRLADAVLIGRSVEIAEACREAGFGIGADFVAQRVAALHANRGPDGALPSHVTGALDIWRHGLLTVIGQENAHG